MLRHKKRLGALASIAALAASALALVVGPAAPVLAGTNANTTYEFDCTSALSAGTVAPFAVTANLNGAPDPSFPTAASFGVTGALTFSLAGGFIAGFASNGVLTAAGVGLTVAGVVVGSTDGTATGSFTYGHSFAQVAASTTALASVTWATASATITANAGTSFTAGEVGDGLAGGTGLPTGATIVAVAAGGGSATINGVTTAASTAVAATLYAPMSFTDAAVSSGNVFTTSGTNGGHANIGLTSATSFSPVVALTIPFGGAPGVGTANCLETGYNAANAAGPVQTGATTPAFPTPALGGPETPLVAASGGFVAQPGTAVKITPPAAAFVALGDAAPVASNGSVSIGTGASKTITLAATDTDVTPVTGFSIVAGSISNARLTVGAPSATGSVTITDTGTGTATVTFQFTATDGIGTSNTATETVSIGSSPVDSSLSQVVTGGSLVISCAAPTPAGGTTPVCPAFSFPAITLNGLQQVETGSGSTLYVSDNRGDPLSGWTLSESVVASTTNTNASCAGLADFCNQTQGAHALDSNGQISAANLAVSAIGCAPFAGNLNPAATAGAGGTFGTAQTICSAVPTKSGGTFSVTQTYALTIPSSVYAGTYVGTVEDLLA